MVVACRTFFFLLSATALSTLLSSCNSTSDKSGSTATNAIVSVRDQRMGVYKDGQLVDTYRISTSKFGVGDRPGSNCTPLGKHEVVAKIGSGLPAGAVLKSRHWNGEVLKPNAPGRDPIVSRILWLNGLESKNRNAYGRFIYIHGTTEENRLGSAASYGCVRMAAKDVIKLYGQLGVGSKVTIVVDRLPRATQGDPDLSPNVSPDPGIPDGGILPSSSIAYSAPNAIDVTMAAQNRGGQIETPPQQPTGGFDPTPAKPAPVTDAAAAPQQPQRLPGPGVILKSRGYSPGQGTRSSTPSSRFIQRG